VILLHDTIPLNERTQERIRSTGFHTGDVWKSVLCLKHFRPDLDIFTVATPWSGLTFVTGLDPRSRVLAENYHRAIEQFGALSYQAAAATLDSALNRVPNSWPLVSQRLRGKLRAA
jgi:hypothetical protein